MESCIFDSDNSFLTTFYTKKEIVGALKEMRPLKAPSSDGFPVTFFHKNWYIMGGEVTSFCLDVLNNKNRSFK